MNSELRQLFPVTKNHVYLNHAAVAPIAIPVYEAMQRYTNDLLQHGLVHWREWGEEVEIVRGLAAQLINAQPHEIAFAANTSTGLSFVANGLDWRAGDNIVTADCEFPANQLPWLRVQKKFGVEIRYAKENVRSVSPGSAGGPPAEVYEGNNFHHEEFAPRASAREPRALPARLDTSEILNLIDERTRVVALSFVEFGSGFRNDLETIGKFCRARDVMFVVDAIQGLGALQLDVEKCCIDALAADAHKFLLGPEGVALFYLSEKMLSRVEPSVVGWTSVKNAFDFTSREKDWADGARRFEPGALNTAGIMGLGASIKMMLEIGTENIEKYLLELTDYLCERLQAVGYSVVSSREQGEASAVVCCTHEKYSAEFLWQELEKQKIIVTPRLGRLRVSPHFYNTHADIGTLIAALPTA